MTDELAVLTRLHSIAKEYDNQPVVVRRGAGILLKFLSHENYDIRKLAAETLQLLSGHPDNPEYLCRERGLVQMLYACYRKAEADDPLLFDVYSSIFDNLKPALESGGEENLPAPKPTLVADGESARVAKNRSARVKSGSMNQCRAMVLAISNMNDGIDELQETLVTTRGVISYTLQQQNKQVVVFLSTPTATLLKILSDSGFDVNVVSESLVDRSAAQHASLDGTTASGYARYASEAADSEYKRSLVLHGIEMNSLAARIRKQHDDRNSSEKKGTLNRVFSALTSGWW